MKSREVEINLKDNTAYGNRGDHMKDETYFIVGEYKDGKLLAFFTHSPWGRTQDQERGWVIIDPKEKKVIDSIETYYYGSTFNDYWDWRARQKNKHGKISYIKDEYGNRVWTMDN